MFVYAYAIALIFSSGNVEISDGSPEVRMALLKVGESYGLMRRGDLENSTFIEILMWMRPYKELIIEAAPFDEDWLPTVKDCERYLAQAIRYNENCKKDYYLKVTSSILVAKWRQILDIKRKLNSIFNYLADRRKMMLELRNVIGIENFQLRKLPPTIPWWAFRKQ
jgi:hypothetical protein